MNQNTVNQQLKRKNMDDNDTMQEETLTATIKRIQTTNNRITTTTTSNTQSYLPSPAAEDNFAMFAPPSRPTTPPLGMTLSHYNPVTGSYTASQFNSDHEVKSEICTGMTPIYRAPFERWGSYFI